MKLFRSKSCVLKGKGEKSKNSLIANQPAQKPLDNLNQQSQHLPQRRFSLELIRNRSKDKTQKDKAYMKVFKQRILNYIELRSDVEIINFYTQYKEQFFRKSLSLQNLLYSRPEIRHKYLSQENSHFFKGFQQTLLSLFRKRIIVPGEFRNMRPQTAQQIEKWVLSWIQRQILYEKAVEEEDTAIKDALSQLQEIQDYNHKVQNEPPLF